MIRFVFYIAVILLVALLLVLGISVIAKFLKNFQPGKSRVAEDIRKMKNALQLFINDLIPWKKEELDLLSFNQVNKKIKKGMVTTGQGVVTSIYHEPMIAWAYKKYAGGGDNAVLYAATSHHEFTFRIRNKQTTIMVDNEVIGQIRKNGLLYSLKTNHLIGRINREDNQLTLPVIIGEKEVATLKKTNYLQETNTRAFELLSELNDQEESILLSLTILEMVDRELK